ncbi:MAG: hypothetical protein FIA93_05610 [Deltaproteobacteria bacterium]|nr:hypothetical protein [Deltaproteobacteria bacterium]
MKSLFLMALVVAVTMMVVAGVAVAGETKAPGYGTFEFQAALETGTLPTGSTDISTAPRKLGIGDVGVDVRYYMGHPFTEGYSGPSSLRPSVIDIGGNLYRVGVDTP